MIPNIKSDETYEKKFKKIYRQCHYKQLFAKKDILGFKKKKKNGLTNSYFANR